MSKTLVAYFSASGVTERVARTLASYRRRPVFKSGRKSPLPPTLTGAAAQARSSPEMNDEHCRPEIAGSVAHMDAYGTPSS